MNLLQRLFRRPRKTEPQTSAPVVHSWKPILSQAELASEIRALIADGREPSAQELLALQDRFSRNLASEIPHFIGHWFADADIRQRDSEYSKDQAQKLEVALTKMEERHGT